MDHLVDALPSTMGTSSTPSSASWSTLINGNGAANDEALSFSTFSRPRISSYVSSTPQLNFKPLQQPSPLQAPAASRLTTSPFPQRINLSNTHFQPNSNATPSNGPFGHSSTFHPQSPVTHQTQQGQRPLWQQSPSVSSTQQQQQQHRPLLPIGMPPSPHPQSLQQPQQQQNQPMMNQLQNNDAWLLAEMTAMLRQNQQQQQQQQQMAAFSANITLSSAAQQILAANANNNNNRPLRSEKIDIEIIKHLIREARWKRRCGMKKEVSNESHNCSLPLLHRSLGLRLLPEQWRK